MSLKSLPMPPVPEEMARIAHAVFPHGNVFMQVRDTLGTIYTDETFADLFPTHGQPASAPWRLALVTVFQFMEHLTDRQAADALWRTARTRTLAERGARAQSICQSSGSRWLDAAGCARGSCHPGLDENAARHHHTTHHVGATV